MGLTLNEANRMVEVAIAKAEELNILINVAVVDAGGRLMAFNRMDGAIWAGVYGSQGKAIGSVAFGRNSGLMQERAGSAIVAGIRQAEGDHLIMSQGGVVLLRDGVSAGACGVGGGTGEEDEICAQAAVDAVS
jgi:glc operon protein GlcG